MNIMKNLIRIASLVAAALLGIVPAQAQLTTTSTTLSVAVLAGGGNVASQSQWCLTSATGVVLPSLSANAVGSYLFVDKEVAQVVSAGSSSTCYNVKRGQLGTSANYGHSVNATLWVGNVATGSGDNSHPFSGGIFTPNVPSGTCTASVQYSLPVIVYGPNNSDFSGGLANCVSGYWSTTTLGEAQGPVTNVNPYTAFTTLSNSIAGTAVTDIAGVEWATQIQIPNSFTSTGACVLNGATVGTDKWLFAIWDATGAVVATTALAGVTTSGASLYQCAAWTATVNLVGPATYFIGLQGNGTTDTFTAYKTGGAPTLMGTVKKAAGVFGTVTAITPTTTFTTLYGPFMMVY